MIVMSSYTLINWLYKKTMRLHDIIIFLWRAIWKEPHAILKLLSNIMGGFFFLVFLGICIAVATEVWEWVKNYVQLQKAYARMDRVREQEADAREERAQAELDRWDEQQRRAKVRIQKAD